jgi:hypothetical protein
VRDESARRWCNPPPRPRLRYDGRVIRPAIVVLFASATACAAGAADPDRPSTTISDDGTSSTGTSTEGDDDDDDGPMACVPGQQIACPCPGGAEGAQACNADGTGYEPCVCPGDTDSVDTGASTSTGVDTGETTAGPNDCAPDSDCLACVTCSVGSSCAELYDACQALDECQAASTCVTQCGFSIACTDKCAPVNDSEASESFGKLGDCLIAECPQCVTD